MAAQRWRGWWSPPRPRSSSLTGTGPWFGAATGKNLIVIQVESLQERGLNDRDFLLQMPPRLAATRQGQLDFAPTVLGPNHGSPCYDRKTLQDVPLAECEQESAPAIRKALLSRRIQELDLQQRLYARLAADPR